MFAEIILPLPLDGTFTYEVPDSVQPIPKVGCRVIVSFGAGKLYSGIVAALTESPPNIEKIKPILECLDNEPVVPLSMLRFWKWLAQYYMCSLGDVMKAALPSGLKPASETSVVLSPSFERWEELSQTELRVVEFLRMGKAITVALLQRRLKDVAVLSTVRRLMAKEAVCVSENIEETFKPRHEVRVRLCETYLKPDAYEALLPTLTPKRRQLVEHYAQLAGLKAAFTLQNNGLIKEVTRTALLETSGASPAIMVGLKSKGIIETYEAEIARLSSVAPSTRSLSPLSEAQQTACDGILREWQQHNVCLLHGVTSSGKTEIYTHLIRRTLEEGRQVLYLVPEIALTTQLTTRLRSVFGLEMGVYHSGFPDSERVEMWKKQLSSQPYNLVLGARSALFLPFQKLGLIIIDEEHETSFKQQDPAPRYNARDAAIYLAATIADKPIHVLLGTATPSIESYHNALQKRYGLVTLTERYTGVALPDIEVANVKRLLETKEMHMPFAPTLENDIRKALEERKQVILFQNRRGYAPIVQCADCAWTPKCDACDVSLTYHQNERQMVCHYCGKHYNIPTRCPNCGGNHLRDLGYGTEKIEEIVRHRFPQARTARIDLDTTRTRSAFERIISDFAAGRTDILIGTQMVTKGLDFDGVISVGILSADTMLTRPDFRSSERAFQMLSQVAGRAGRREGRGHVVLQTRMPDDETIDYVVHGDYKGFYVMVEGERRAFGYPPFTRLIYIYLKHRDQQLCVRAATMLTSALRQHIGKGILGPDSPVVGRMQGLYIQKIVVKADASFAAMPLRNYLRETANWVKSQPGLTATQVYFDVDPM